MGLWDDAPENSMTTPRMPAVRWDPAHCQRGGATMGCEFGKDVLAGVL